MSKLTNYMMMLVGLVLLLTFAGIPTGTHKLLEKFNVLSAPESIGTPPDEGITFSLTNLKSLSFFQWMILGTGALGLLAAITIGFITKSSGKDYIIGIMVCLIGLYFVGEFTGIIVYVNGLYKEIDAWSWVSNIITIVYGMLTIGFIMSIIDFWHGGS